MIEKRRAIDARARQIVEESDVLWAVARDQAMAEDARARRIVEESGVPLAVAADQAKTELGAQSAHALSSVEQSGSDGERSRRGAVVGGCVAVLLVAGVAVGAVGLILASLLFSDDAGQVRDEYTEIARPALVIASNTLVDLGLDPDRPHELPEASQLEPGDPDYPEGCDCFIVSLGEISSVPVDRDYRVAFDAVEAAFVSAGIGEAFYSSNFGARRHVPLAEYSWSIFMDANRKAKTLEVYAYGSIDGLFES